MKKRPALAARLRRVYRFLKKTDPLPDTYDVCWQAPYFIPRRGEWRPSHVMLYQGTLYCRIFIPPSFYEMSWVIGSNDVAFERPHPGGDYVNDAPLWEWTLTQIEHRLQWAVKNFPRYNRHIERHLPLACRTGKIMRRLTWQKNIRSAIPERAIRGLEETIRMSKGRPSLPKMTLSRYLTTTAVAYDAVFKELRRLTPREKYRRRADGRHGGLLDLPPHDGDAFSRWYRSREWLGCHPWEIVFGHPHGIMIAPDDDRENGGWRFRLWVESPGWYTSAARMAIALGRRGIPFELAGEKKVIDAIKGIDDVEVGPDLYATHYEDLKERRPDVLDHIRWDPIPPMAPITPVQRDRIARAECCSKPNGVPTLLGKE